MKVLVTVLFLSSCSFFIKGNEGPKSAKGSSYSIHFSKPDWIYTKDKRSDYVFENSKDGRILLSNSFCDEFQEQPLKQLAHKTFKTVTNFKAVVKDYTTFQNREAYKLEGSGLVDGVKVGLRLLNTRRNNCYFDFLSINPEGSESQDEDFQDFLKTVVFK